MIALVALAPTAVEVVKHVQDHYAKLPQLTATFDQKVTNGLTGKVTPSHGSLAFAKPDKGRMNYVKVVNQKEKKDKDFVSDGTTLWIIDYMNLEIRITGIASNPTIDAIGAFLMNGNLAATYDVALAGNMLELTPKQPVAGVKRVDFVVDMATWSVTESIIRAPNDEVSDFTFSAISSVVPPGTFSVDPKAMPSFKVIQMAAPVTPAAPTSPAKPTPTAPTRP